MKNLKRKAKWNIWKITMCFLAMFIVIGLFIWLQITKYEDGVMEIYATEQDGYVQLVLDQINLLDEEAKEESVKAILETLDASNSQFWTFSNKETLLFVKDVLETNRYKGFTTSSYYVSESAQAFLGQLKVNKVTHSTIQMNDENFIISGVEFEFRGENYRICLLTNSKVVLNHNAYLSAKINLVTLAVLVLALILVLSIALATYAEKQNKKYLEEKASNVELRTQIEMLNQRLVREELFDTKYLVFHKKAMPIVLSKINEKSAWPLAFVLIDCTTSENQKVILEQSQAMMDKRMLRVAIDERYLLVVILKCKKWTDYTSITTVLNLEANVVDKLYLEERTEESLETVCEQFLKKVRNHGE